ncbi:DNA-directed RNA polymerases I and III subunit RPAC1-like [Ciona intestinalis]
MDIIKDIRSNIRLNEHGIANTHTTTYPRSYAGFNDAWDFQKFAEHFCINVIELGPDSMQFDMIGVDAAIANAFRRILIAEVPTMAIEKIYIYNNTTVIQDEVLAHRLGLIPLTADAKLFEYRQGDDADGTPEDTLEFELNIKCTKNLSAPKDTTDLDVLYKHHKVYSKDIKWIPLGNQKDLLTVKPVYDDILVAKLRPGHILDVKLHAVKGVGQDHAKFSPVATAAYRLLPQIRLLDQILNSDAEDLQRCFAPGVIEVYRNKNGDQEARVVDARKDTCSREVLRHPHLKDRVELSKVRDHFIYSIESSVSITPNELMCRSIKIMMGKCRTLLQELEKSEQDLDNA